MKVCNTFRILGTSSHSTRDRQIDDYYATDPTAIDRLASILELPKVIWEPACGGGHLAERLKQYGCKVIASDLIDRGYGTGGIDFMQTNSLPVEGCAILTNPPYKQATEFVRHMLALLPNGGLGIMFLKLQFLEGIERQRLFSRHPPKKILVFSQRIACAKDGNFAALKKSGGSAVCYAWFVWEKGYKEQPQINWI